jgi:Ran GTPase-activating protein (RanGAP) involved in mRNA processing and transport
VNLAHYGLGPNGIKPVVEAMRLNPPLKSLVLSDNWLYEEGGLEIAKCALCCPRGAHCLTLRYLLRVPFLRCRFIAVNTTLTQLDLSDNSMGTAAVGKILSAAAWNITLQHFTLRGNNATSAVARSLGDVLSRCANLVSLDLSFNRLGDAGAQAIADALPSAGVLCSLNLSWNREFYLCLWACVLLSAGARGCCCFLRRFWHNWCVVAGQWHCFVPSAY